MAKKRKAARDDRFVLDPTTGRPITLQEFRATRRAMVQETRATLPRGKQRRRAVRGVKRAFRRARRGRLPGGIETMGQAVMDPATGQPVIVNIFGDQGAGGDAGYPPGSFAPAQSQPLLVTDRTKIDLANQVGGLV